jgi:hypothetical protein
MSKSQRDGMSQTQHDGMSQTQHDGMTEFEFKLLGRSIQGSSLSGVAALIRRLFDFPNHANALEINWQIFVVQTQAPIPILENAYQAAVHQGFVNIATLENSTWITLEENAVQLELNNAGAKLTLHGSNVGLMQCVMVGMIEAIRASGIIPMHTSIASQNGIGTAFTGESGRGKTTTLIHSLKAGFLPICEDFAWLEPHSLQVFGCDRGLRCLPDTLERVKNLFPNIEPIAFEVDKHLVPFEQLAPRAWQCRLERLWTLERDLTKPTHLEPLPAAQRVMALYGATGVPLTAQTRALSVQHMASLAKRLEIQCLQIGNTVLPF